MFYASNKTAYPLTFRFYKQKDENDQNYDNKHNLTREIVTELEEEADVPSDTYLFDSWFTYDS